MRLFCLPFILLMYAQAAVAATSVYDCKIKERGSSGWVPEQVIIEWDTDTNEALVRDPIILHFNDKRPLPAKIPTDNAKRTTFTWTLQGVKGSSGQYAPKFSFRASFLKASKKMVVSASPLGYSNRFTGEGRCRLTVK